MNHRMELITIDQIQSHTNDRCVALSVKATKMSARLLTKAMQAFLKRAKQPHIKTGEQSLKSLTKQGASIENVTVSGDNVGKFRKVARKYNIDFALKKDDSGTPPNWIVFFKSKDAKALDSAFKEFSQDILKDKTPKLPIAKEMERFKEIAEGLTPATPTKGKIRGDMDL